jgi:hypothetical protein
VVKDPPKIHEKVITWIEHHPTKADEMLTASAGESGFDECLSSTTLTPPVPSIFSSDRCLADGTIKVWERKAKD